jgi:uncharacterized ion transporter superfamily protein YfcC
MLKMKKPKSLPTPLTLMMMVIIIAAISTWLLPAGQYSKLSAADKTFTVTAPDTTITLPFTQHTLDSLNIKIAVQKFENGDIRKAISVPGTYKQQGRKGQGFIAVLQAPVKGIVDSIDIILFILMIGGFMSVFNKTGAMFKGITYLAHTMKGKEQLLILILIFIFSFLGGSYGMDVEAIIFYPVLVPLLMAAGYDLMVPLAIVFGGACVGYISSFSNPFSAIIASNSAGINWTDGLYERLLFFVISTSLFAWYVLRYARKVKKDPTASIVYKIDGTVHSPYEMHVHSDQVVKLDWKTKLLLLIFTCTFTGMIVGIVFFNWWTTEMSSLFLSSAILVGIIERVGEKEFIAEFINGARSLLSVAFIVGLARGVTIVLNDGLIADSILFYTANVVQHFSPVIFIILTMLFYFLFTIPVSSSSGMAVLTMPIIGALAIIINIPGREVVNSYLFGIGVMYLITPTGSVFPALEMVKVSYKAWLKFIMPMVIALLILGTAFLVTGIYF